MNEDKKRDIRFINSSYDTLFRIPDGGTIEVRFPDRVFTSKCEYIDSCHTRVGYSVYHVCEFAEMIERQGGSVRPEPEVEADRAAWHLGGKEYLLLEKSEDGIDYTICSREFLREEQGKICGGISMKEAREKVLDEHGFSYRTRTALPPETVISRIHEADRSVLERLKDLGISLRKEHPETDRGKEARHAGEPAR